MNILAVGAHPDDIEFGCFGTLIYYSNLKHSIYFNLFSSGELLGKIEMREKEAEKSAKLIGAKIDFFRYPDANISVTNKTIDKFREYIDEIKPDTLFIHHPYDNHQDHRATTQICLSCSDYFDKIYFYEGPSSFNFSPKIFFIVDKQFNKKITALKTFTSQTVKPYLDIKAIEGLARYRGYQSGLYGHLCEAFSCYKLIERDE